MGHLGVVLYEYLGEEYPEVLGSILGALKAIVNVIGMSKMTPPIKDLLPRLTPILKNRHEKVQENCRVTASFFRFVPVRDDAKNLWIDSGDAMILTICEPFSPRPSHTHKETSVASVRSSPSITRRHRLGRTHRRSGRGVRGGARVDAHLFRAAGDAEST